MALNSVSRQIFAMGGGGFSMESENLLLDKYILGLSKQKKPKVCFIPTASSDSDKYIMRFYSRYIIYFVSSRPDAKAYRVEKLDKTVRETILEPIYLGKK